MKTVIYQSHPMDFRLSGDQYCFHLYTYRSDYNFSDTDGKYILGKNFFEG